MDKRPDTRNKAHHDQIKTYFCNYPHHTNGHDQTQHKTPWGCNNITCCTHTTTRQSNDHNGKRYLFIASSTVAPEKRHTDTNDQIQKFIFCRSFVLIHTQSTTRRKAKHTYIIYIIVYSRTHHTEKQISKYLNMMKRKNTRFAPQKRQFWG